jgi:Na+/proline symporter
LLSAYLLTDVVQGIEIFWKISPLMGIAFWLGLFWRRATTAGAWASTVAAFAMWMLTEQSFFLDALGQFVPEWLHAEGGLRLHWQMILYLSTGFAVGILVSLLTRPVAEEKLERFYALVRTPVDTEEGSPSEPCTLPQGIVAAPRRLWLEKGGLEILRPSRSTVIGFILCWIAVALMILGFWAVTR